ncbi:chaplin [Streptomyces sp. NPDC004647]|uniref:chaplin n=1 Tax=Streptomyces sp. NPDC004647 TaxID=3154671 RepID=UPI0033B8A6FB
MKAIKSVAIVGAAAGLLIAGAGAAVAHDGKAHDGKAHDKGHHGKAHEDKAHEDKGHYGKAHEDKGHYGKAHEDKGHYGKAHAKAHQDSETKVYSSKKTVVSDEDTVRGVAIGSPGTGSGNVIQTITNTPTNVCNNPVIGAGGILNPSFGNSCVNR